MRLASIVLLLPPLTATALAADAPLQVGLPVPPLLDLRGAALAELVPADPRDPAQVEATRLAWQPWTEPFANSATVRLRVPQGEARLPMLLAASQALRARNAEVRIFLCYDPAAAPILEESAWGALHGGILGPEDLGADPGGWRDLLVRAQDQLPGRSWHLWTPADPLARCAMLLGDGGRLVVPPGGPSAGLAAMIPEGFTEVEGGMGDLTLRHFQSGQARRWRFQSGNWVPSDLPKHRHEVNVTAEDTYDVAALLARMRATQQRDQAALRTAEARLVVDLHIQSEQMGGDLGYSFQAFAKAGDTEELLQEEVRFNGVRANLQGGTQLPIVESRASLAAPVALGLTERYRYRDGGPGGEGKRRIRFEPVDRDARMPEGELLVEERTGRVLEELHARSELPGIVKSEKKKLFYGEPAPGLWRVVRMESFERWVTAEGVSQVQRRMVYSEFQVNAEGFETRRDLARRSKSTMLKQTLNGVRYFSRQDDGTRKIEAAQQASGKGWGLAAIVQSDTKPHLIPAAGFSYFNFNAFERGIQVNCLAAGIFNTASVVVPNLPGGLDAGLRVDSLLLATTEKPVKGGKLLDQEGIDRTYGSANLDLARDLGAGFRMDLQGRFRYDSFKPTRQADLRTAGYQAPPSGWTRSWQTALTWQRRGFELAGQFGEGRRPDGSYGLAADPQAIPAGGRFRIWGGSANYDHLFEGNWRMKGGLGRLEGTGFDRFLSAASYSGLGSTLLASDRIDFLRAGVVLPPSPNLRLSFGLDYTRSRSLDDRKSYGATGLSVSGDLPGFGWFTTVRVDLKATVQSDVTGLRSVQGTVTFMRIF